MRDDGNGERRPDKVRYRRRKSQRKGEERREEEKVTSDKRKD